MAKINLRDYYPFYNADLFIDIPDVATLNSVILLSFIPVLSSIQFSVFPKRPASSWLVKTKSGR